MEKLEGCVWCSMRQKDQCKSKRKVYKTVMRPAMMYGGETWPIKKAQGQRLDVAEMRMLRWMCGITMMDKIRNEKIRGTT